MRNKLQKPRSVGFKVIKGGGQGLESTPDPGKRPLFFLLLFLALFLLAQILVGWIWGIFSQRSVKTTLAAEGSLELTMGISGLATFNEEIIFSPRPGYIYYLVQEGSRVPVGLELARIHEFPLEEMVIDEGERGVSDYFSRLKDWFLHGDTGEEVDYFSLFPINEETSVVNPTAGLVSLKIDGWEKFGPRSGFLYLTEDEFTGQPYQAQKMANGDKVSRFTPLLRIIDNYTWYFSAVLSAAEAELLVGKPEVVLYFSFAPGDPVTGELVEIKEKEEVVEITWAINQYVEDFYNQRWCEAEIVYDEISGVMIPETSLEEKEGDKGVFVIDKGLIVFREVDIIGEKEGYCLVKNLEPYERVVLNPGKAKEGQRFSW